MFGPAAVLPTALGNSEYYMHPLTYSSCFVISGSEDISGKNCSMINFSIRGIAKMLVYGDFLGAQALKYNKSVTSLVAEESALYPYKRKDIQKVSKEIKLTLTFY